LHPAREDLDLGVFRDDRVEFRVFAIDRPDRHRRFWVFGFLRRPRTRLSGGELGGGGGGLARQREGSGQGANRGETSVWGGGGGGRVRGGATRSADNGTRRNPRNKRLHGDSANCRELPG